MPAHDGISLTAGGLGNGGTEGTWVGGRGGICMYILGGECVEKGEGGKAGGGEKGKGRGHY